MTSRNSSSRAKSAKGAALKALRDAREGVISRADQYAHLDESAADVYDEVSTEDAARIEREMLRSSAFIIDDDNAGYHDGLENWEDDRAAADSDLDDDSDDEDLGKSKKGRSSRFSGTGARKRTHAEANTTSGLRPIADAFAVAQAKARVAPVVPASLAPAAKRPAITNQGEQDFMDDLLASFSPSTAAGGGAKKSAGGSAAKRPRLFPSALTSGTSLAPLPLKSHSSLPLTTTTRASSFAAGNAGNDGDDDTIDYPTDEPSSLMDMDWAPPGAPIMDEPPTCATTGVGSSSSAAAVKAGVVKLEPDMTDDTVGPAATAEPQPQVRKITTIKPKVRLAQAAIEMPIFPTSGSSDPVTSATTMVNTATASSSSIPPAAVLEQDGSLLMYYLDAVEERGVVYLFGKVRVRPPPGIDAPLTWVSCAVAVHGIERNIFLLPRAVHHVRGIDGKWAAADQPVAPTDVYQEFERIRRQHRISRTATKFVDRKYAFEVPNVPQEEKWMKVAYSFNEAALPSNLEGETFSHVFGTNTSALELLVLKRKLMGPGWIRIADAQFVSPGATWAKLECIVSNPKTITAIPLGQGPADSPPLTVAALSLKTVLNRLAHQEIVVLTMLTYSIAVDAAGTAGEPVPMHRVVMVRAPHGALPVSEASLGSGTKVHTSEFALINHWLSILQLQDPDVLVGHNLLGFDIDVLSARFRHHNVKGWSRLGRMRRTDPPPATASPGSAHRIACRGRLLVDTYLAAKEFIGSSKSYSLNYLAETQLMVQPRGDLDFMQIPTMMSAAQGVVHLLQYAVQDGVLVVQLAHKLKALSLYLQIANICGNVLSRTMVGGRAERNEWLLLHEFHEVKYIVPDKAQFGSGNYKSDAQATAPGKKKGSRKSAAAPDSTSSVAVVAPSGNGDFDGEGDDDEGVADLVDVGPEVAANPGQQQQQQGGGGSKRRKPQYAGGLVLEPKRGFYDTYVLLLDFNSLYPSIIQEYNICFTTVSRTTLSDDGYPPLPPQEPAGHLPRIIKQLVNRRRAVKNLMKSCAKHEYQQYNIRQLALKLTANSMYGCLGFTGSRFCCKPLAALITKRGREILQATVDLANGNGMQVIYGDTDSIMINTGTTDPAEVRAMGRKLKDLVNKQYKCLEIEMDGMFERMLLLMKKKYAAVVLDLDPITGETLSRKLEVKGLDQVRRDWCGLSHEVSEYVLNQLLMSKNSREQVVAEIHEFLERIATDARAGNVALDLFVINKGLTKPPRMYDDALSQPHVQVALAMEARGERAIVGGTVPYVITAAPTVPAKHEPGMPTGIAARARHPADLARDESLKVDVEWYLSQQVLPPVTRLCAEMEGTDASQLAHKLGLDPRTYAIQGSGGSGGGGDSANNGMHDVKPLDAMLTDEERFAAAEKFTLKCRTPSCAGNATPFVVDGTFRVSQLGGSTSTTDADGATLVPGWTCPHCWHQVPIGSVVVQLTLAVRKHIAQYGQRRVACSDLTCGARSRNVRVYGSRCPNAPRCNGKVHLVYSPDQLYRQLSFYAHLFDLSRLRARKPKDANQGDRIALLEGWRGDYDAAYACVKSYLGVNDRTQVDLGSLFAFMRLAKPKAN
ncbi:hypothetical protein BC828DRAFT_402699 [Blastocladiella britannica]|nr:hypothetical protein BC828DRAFT_402699 [Blastocladiella britannica]